MKKEETKHIVCYSGGHSSALVAIMVAQRHGKNNMILLNHDISENVEDSDIKRFKKEVADYLGIKITYANMEGWEDKDQFDVSIDAKAFKTNDTPAICTSRLKTKPFKKFLEAYNNKKSIVYYGFDANEIERIVRRTYIMALDGWKTEYPLATWAQGIKSTKEIGIEPPLKYGKFKHANCTGCIKGGAQHWYVVFMERPDIFKKAKEAEEKIGHSILKDGFLKDIECKFENMAAHGIEPTEHIKSQTFWANVERELKAKNLFNFDIETKPCACTS
jgi:hypothetical protein